MRESQASAKAYKDFLEHINLLGGIVVEKEWLGSLKPHEVICNSGHTCFLRPNTVQQNQGMLLSCRICANQDPKTAEANFRARLAELGAVMLEPIWLGSGKPHRVRCNAGHDCNPRPNSVQRGNGICRICAGNDSATAEANFRTRLAELGAVMLEPIWRGAAKPHHVRCRAGHDCYPCPNDVKKGVGICKSCSYTWDVFYIVAMADHSQIKFGITSNDPKPRLWAHARDGYDVVIRLYTSLPDSHALEIEQRIMAYMKNANLTATRGREYLNGAALPAILAVVDAVMENQMPADRLDYMEA